MMDAGLIFLSYETPPGPDGRKTDQLSTNEPIYSTCKSLERPIGVKTTPKRESWEFILESKNTTNFADLTNMFGSLDISGINLFHPDEKICKNEKVRLCESSRKMESDFFADLERKENFKDDSGTISTVSEFILIPKSISSQETIQAMNNQHFHYHQNSSSPIIIGPKTNMYKKFAGYKNLYDNQKLMRKNSLEKRCSSLDHRSRRSIFLIVALLLICTFLVISGFLIKRLYFDNLT